MPVSAFIAIETQSFTIAILFKASRSLAGHPATTIGYGPRMAVRLIERACAKLWVLAVDFVKWHGWFCAWLKWPMNRSDLAEIYSSDPGQGYQGTFLTNNAIPSTWSVVLATVRCTRADAPKSIAKLYLLRHFFSTHANLGNPTNPFSAPPHEAFVAELSP